MMFLRLSPVVVLAVTLMTPFSAYAFTPNDTFYGRQWYLPQIHAEQAWDITTGSPNVVVAVVDTAMDIDHEDLKDNIWTNPHDTFGNGKDDDHNGFVDDVHGWNFLNNSNEVRPTSGTGTDHGRVHATLVASLIAAKGNNGIGIAGVAWNVKIMPLVALAEDGGGNTTDVANAIRYAADNGANIINLSLEGYNESDDVDQAIAYASAKGVLTVAAAGNADDPAGLDLDQMKVFPVCLSTSASYGLIGVGSTDRNDRQAPFANYGSCVEVSAPGDDIFGAIPTDPDTGAGYAGGFSGTSMAVPLISGTAALIKSLRPDWGWAEIRDRIMMSADPIDQFQDPALRGKLGRGRLDVAAALSGLTPFVPTSTTWTIATSAVHQPTRVQVTSGSSTIDLVPFGATDTRGSRALVADIDGDGHAEIVVVPASGKTGDWAVYGLDGSLRIKGNVASNLKDGLVVAVLPQGFVLADPDGGRAWGMTAAGKDTLFYPYGPAYHAGLDLVSVPTGVAFVPHGGGGQFTIMDGVGNRLYSWFPFGKTARGHWTLTANADGTLTMSGPLGSIVIDPAHLPAI